MIRPTYVLHRLNLDLFRATARISSPSSSSPSPSSRPFPSSSNLGTGRHLRKCRCSLKQGPVSMLSGYSYRNASSSAVKSPRMPGQAEVTRLLASLASSPETRTNPADVFWLFDRMRANVKAKAKGRGGPRSGADTKAWTALLSFAASSPHVPAGSLLPVLTAPRASSGYNLGPPAWSAVLKGLYTRREHSQAERVWEKMVERGVSMNPRTLTVRCRGLGAQRKWQEAMRTLQLWCRRQEDGMPAAWRPSLERGQYVFAVTAPAPERGLMRYRVQADAALINTVMEGLARSNQPLLAYRLFRSMGRYFDVPPNDASLRILMGAARVDQARLTPEDLNCLSPFLRPAVDVDHTLWDGLPARLVARHIFRQALLGNVPSLSNVQNPMAGSEQSWWMRGEARLRELRRRWGQWVAAEVEFVHGHVGHTSHQPLSDGGQYGTEAAKRLPGGGRRPLFAHIRPSASTFHSYLLLLLAIVSPREPLARAEKPPHHPFSLRKALSSPFHNTFISPSGIPSWDELPLVLAWMRELEVVPERRSLVLVCMKVAEEMPPLVAWRSDVQRSSTEKAGDPAMPASDGAGGSTLSHSARSSNPIAPWIEGWLGPEAVPAEDEIIEFRRRGGWM